MPGWDDLIDLGQKVAQVRRFFHWELEFPEVFFDEHGRLQGETAGFDAVVGNPPYVRQEELGIYKPYLSTEHLDVYHGVADLYVYFISMGVKLLRNDGILGYITSGTFRRLRFGLPLRQFLSEKSSIHQLIDLEKAQIFDGVTTYPIIVVLGKQVDKSGIPILYADVEDVHRFKDLKITFVECNSPHGAEEWFFVPPALQRIIGGWNGSVELRNLLAAGINRGVTTGANDIFIVDDTDRQTIISSDERSSEIIKPYVRGEDLDPWVQKSAGLWLIFTRRGINIDAFPGVKQYLERHKYRLEPKPVDWPDDTPWSGRKQGHYDWFEIQDSVEYYQVFERPRIFSTKVSRKPTFSYSKSTMYGGNTSYILPTDNERCAYFLLCILNSRLAEFYFRSVFTPKANGYYEVQPEPLEKLPIPNIISVTPDDKKEQLLAEAKTLAAEAISTTDFGQIRAFVSAQLAAEPERSDVVHDLLAHLAEQMIELNRQRQKLKRALDPFKWLDRGAAFTPFTQVFAEEIKYGERADLAGLPDLRGLDVDHHDVEQLRLTPLGPLSLGGSKGGYELQAYLKHRDPATDWRKALKDENGKIVRAWVPVYRFEMDPTQAQFYTHALPVLDQFTAYKKFPGGKTRTTLQKLHAGRLPVFNPAIDLTPLEELTAELTLARARIMRTDELIDQIVYKLYGLTEEEIGIVEGLV